MNKCNLVLHCGANAVERDDLLQVRTPASTDSWQPIPHQELLRHVENALPSHGLRVMHEAHALTHDGGRYFGLLQVQNGSNNPDYSWVLGLRNSHDKVLPAGLVVGSQVFVCDNLAFSGDVTIARKHTRFILRDLPGLIGSAIGKLIHKWRDQDTRVARYKACIVSDVDAHDLTIRAMDREAFPTRLIPDVLEEWRKPQHEAFQPRNLWSFFNAVTERIKGGNLQVMPVRTQALHRVCDEYAGLN